MRCHDLTEPLRHRRKPKNARAVSREEFVAGEGSMVPDRSECPACLTRTGNADWYSRSVIGTRFGSRLQHPRRRNALAWRQSQNWV